MGVFYHHFLRNTSVFMTYECQYNCGVQKSSREIPAHPWRKKKKKRRE
jgi:hypothetical protein